MDGDFNPFKIFSEVGKDFADKLGIRKNDQVYWGIPFFSIEKDGKTSYLLGTVHLGIGRDNLPPKILEIFERCDILAVERRGSSNVIEGERREKIQNRMRKELTQTIEGQADDDHPFGRVLMSLMTLFGGESIDLSLADSARENEKQVISLDSDEDVRDAVSTVERLTNLKSALMDKGAIQDLMSDPQKYIEMFQAKTVNPFIFTETANRWMEEEADRDPVIVDERNFRWVVKLLPFLKNGGIFIAVGAGHFQGKHAIQKLIADKGFNVKRISFEPEV